jgi:hypothetical protein
LAQTRHDGGQIIELAVLIHAANAIRNAIDGRIA